MKWLPKEFYIIWLDENDIPKGVLTGPFENVEQSIEAIEALKPLHPGRRLSVVGGNLERTWK